MYFFVYPSNLFSCFYLRQHQLWIRKLKETFKLR